MSWLQPALRLVGATLGLTASAATAQVRPPMFAPDPRIQGVIFSPDRVVPLRATVGYAVVVEFADDERVENVVVGNSGGWQVTANKRGDHLIVKPSAEASMTDLVVTTDLRRYVFLLQLANAGEQAPFVVHFNYGEVSGPLASPNVVQVSSFKLQGDKALFPTTISDDGQRTYVTWSRATPLPAIFAVDAKGHEAIINGRMVDGAFVIERIAPRWVFRLDKAQAIATRRIPKGVR